MIHTSAWQPRVYPYKGDIAPVQIDRLQDLTASVTLNREKIREIGRDGTVDWRKRIPSTRVTLRQLEYGDLEFYRKLGNLADATNDVTLNDFKTSMVDICGYKTDDDGTFLGTVWYPKLRVAGFGINIGDPQALIERNFDLVGEDESILKDNNAYFNYQRFSASGGTPESLTINSPSPVADPETSGGYLFRVLRVRGTTTTELTSTAAVPTGDNYRFNAPSTLQVATNSGDIIKVYYSAATFNTQSQSVVFTNNNADPSGLLAEAASIFLYVSSNSYIYRLQSVAIDIAFDRTDYYEVGNSEVVQRGIREKTVRITLGRILEAYTVEEVLRGVNDAYGRINNRLYRDDITLRVKLYRNSIKSDFDLGFKATNLSPVSVDAGVPLNDYATRNAVLEGEDFTISATEATIDA